MNTIYNHLLAASATLNYHKGEFAPLVGMYARWMLSCFIRYTWSIFAGMENLEVCKYETNQLTYYHQLPVSDSHIKD